MEQDAVMDQIKQTLLQGGRETRRCRPAKEFLYLALSRELRFQAVVARSIAQDELLFDRCFMWTKNRVQCFLCNPRFNEARFIERNATPFEFGALHWKSRNEISENSF